MLLLKDSDTFSGSEYGHGFVVGSSTWVGVPCPPQNQRQAFRVRLDWDVPAGAPSSPVPSHPKMTSSSSPQPVLECGGSASELHVNFFQKEKEKNQILARSSSLICSK